MRKIGVFDSGIGGRSIAQAIQKALPDVDLEIASDTAHMPYGDKSPAQVLGFVVPILQDLVARGCDVVVIACNTVTTHHIQTLRQTITVPLVGIEPMVKPAAALTKSGVIAVCATPATLASARYHELKQQYAKGVTVLEPDCSRWAYMIEHDVVDEHQIEQQINSVCDAGADVIVLGCTHYHWIDHIIIRLANGRATVVTPEKAVIRQLKRVLDAVPVPQPRP